MTDRKEPRLSVPGLLCVWLLSDHRLRTTNCQWLKTKAQREALYDCHHVWLTRSPDHVFENAWHMLNFEGKARHPCIESLVFLQNELLVRRHQRWYVKPEAMGAWQQGLCSRMSQLPLMAWVGASDLPVKPHSNVVEDYLSREGLHETHVHLNGSSHGERAWLHALEHPLESSTDFSNKFHKGPNKENVIRDLVRNIDPALTPAILIHRLREARKLRRLLMHAAFDDCWWATAKVIDIEDAESYPDRNSFYLKTELHWHTAFLSKCRDHPGHRVLPEAYHQYLLLMNQYYQLTVQNEQRVGFDQFQKHADAGLREHLEDDFFERFKDAHGNNLRRSRVQFYEGRFAPKENTTKLQNLLLKILHGYHRYLSSCLPQESVLQKKRSPHRLPVLLTELDELTAALENSGIEPLRLTLVCHFIKKRWSTSDIKHAPYRHHALVKSLRNSTNALLWLLKRYPRLKDWVRGIDGAANELHAPPEFCTRLSQVRSPWRYSQNLSCRGGLSALAFWPALHAGGVGIFGLASGGPLGARHGHGHQPPAVAQPHATNHHHQTRRLVFECAGRMAVDVQTTCGLRNRCSHTDCGVGAARCQVIWQTPDAL